MAGQVHPSAGHLPAFITAPGETDVLLVVVVLSLLAIVLIVGNFYFKLHALPEKMAHKANSVQLQLVGVLALLALFTHNNLFWVAALLIAALRMPDFSTPLNSMARSLAELSSATGTPGAAPAGTRGPQEAGGSEHSAALAPPDPTRR